MSDEEIYVPLKLYEEVLKQLYDFKALFYVLAFILGLTLLTLFFVIQSYIKLKKENYGK